MGARGGYEVECADAHISPQIFHHEFNAMFLQPILHSRPSMSSSKGTGQAPHHQLK